jgi:hypothetical protein
MIKKETTQIITSTLLAILLSGIISYVAISMWSITSRADNKSVDESNASNYTNYTVESKYNPDNDIQVLTTKFNLSEKEAINTSITIKTATHIQYINDIKDIKETTINQVKYTIVSENNSEFIVSMKTDGTIQSIEKIETR